MSMSTLIRFYNAMRAKKVRFRVYSKYSYSGIRSVVTNCTSQIIRAHVALLASYTDFSICRWKICSQRKARRRKRARRLGHSFILLPIDLCASSPTIRVSLAFRARLCPKKEVPEERLLLYEVEPWHSPEIF